MIYKQPLNIDVILQLFEQVVKNTSEYLEKAQQYDKEYSFDIVEEEKVVEILSKYKKQKLLYATNINDNVYYNNEDVITIYFDSTCNVYDYISVAVAVLLTQNRAVFFVDKLSKSYSFDLVLNLLKKFDSSLKLYDEYINVRTKLKKQIKYDYTLSRKDDKLLYKRKMLEVEFDFNLLLKAYPVK